jgi:prophage regulatory protein
MKQTKPRRGEKLRAQIATYTATHQPGDDPCRVMRVHEVSALLGVHVMTIWKWAAAGKMPKPFKLGQNVVAWRARDISGWLDRKAGETVTAASK